MKQLLLILTLLFVNLGFSKSKGTLTINYSFSHIEVGYDHLTKCKVFIDGDLFFESKEHKQSEAQSFDLKIPKGNHKIRIVILSQYEGVWEEHSIDNNYSTNAMFTDEIILKKKSTIHLEFDLDQPQPIVKKG